MAVDRQKELEKMCEEIRAAGVDVEKAVRTGVEVVDKFCGHVDAQDFDAAAEVIMLLVKNGKDMLSHILRSTYLKGEIAGLKRRQEGK